jgi:CRISPR-associated protein Cmr2
MNDNNKYLALTIGPIYETFAQVKRTRAVWAASYFFSWFLKQVVRKTHKDFKILLPALNEEGIIFHSRFGSGLYADRIYFEPSAKTKADLEKIVDDVISKIAEDIDKSNTIIIEEYMKQYLNLHIIELEISEKEDVLKTLNDLLDLKELTQNYAFKNEGNFLITFLENRDKLKESILSKDAFGDKFNVRHFRSIPEIATTTLERTVDNAKYIKALRKDFKNEDTDLIDELKKQDFKILPFHKYYAVLYADGDNIGSLLKLMPVTEKTGLLQEFSTKIFEFGIAAERIFAEYGGNGIYLGGEDVLAFIPVACINEAKTATSTLFKLIHDLDICFKKFVGDFAEKNNFPVPTLSYGIMVSYIKHPLKEAMQKAHALMDEVAKKMPCKNSIGLHFQKHSGQYMECCIEKSKTCSWDYIKELVNEYTINLHEPKESERNDELLSGVIHRLKDDMYFEVFALAARGKRLEPFFENFFDEKVHKGDDNPRQAFLKKVRGLSERVFNDYPDNQQCRDILFTVLRFIHFVNSEKE